MVETSTIDPQAADVADRRVSPAQHLHRRLADARVVGERGVSVRELPFLTMVGLRLREGSPSRVPVESRLGTPLPARCGYVAVGVENTVIWLSPDEFLVVSDTAAAPDLVDDVEGIVAGSADAVLDLSANRTTFLLEGPAARDVLEKGCPVDLHPRAFEVGAAVSTTLGRVPLIVHKTGAEAYRLMPRASFADHLGRWLIDAMAEFQEPRRS